MKQRDYPGMPVIGERKCKHRDKSTGTKYFDELSRKQQYSFYYIAMIYRYFFNCTNDNRANKNISCYSTIQIEISVHIILHRKNSCQ